MKYKRILKAINHYFIFFLLVAFVVTCCMMLFLSTIAKSLDITFTEENLSVAAKITFLNVVLLSGLFTIIDFTRRKLTVHRPVKKITVAAEKMMQGDFNIRLNPINEHFGDESFNEIISCINKMALELSSVETLRNDFVSNVSHELKTPLSVISNYATLLKSENITEEERLQYANEIENSCKRLSNLISNILKLNKLENQQIFPKSAEYNLSEQICECLLQFETSWEKKNINIETDIEDEVKINSDAELLSHIWNNLFSNAIKFTENGGTVFVSLKSDGDYITAKVRDTGCGMSPEVGLRIFDKFYQGDTSHSVQGNGLGLSLVRRVVDIMQGEINVESEIGKGSTFTVKFKKNI
ncbi:MAG: HAMP domain-containing histidine kinase [Oscillospiraceae bacterium]|nr:HAMP domain-containing histidine kinase [Oscillospiraceae bacterium]